MSYLFGVLLMTIQVYPLFGQETNEWINYQQSYIRIGVDQKGVIRIPVSKLSQEGFSITESDLVYLQLFHRGKEIPIISASKDEIIFYGEPNSGERDSLLYRPNSSRMNPYYSIYSNIGYYFLTKGKELGKRALIEEIERDITELEQIKWHWKELLVTYPQEHTHNAYSVELPSLLQSYFSNEETFTSTPKSGLSSFNYSFSLKNLFQENFISPQLQIMVNGRTNGNNNIELNVGAAKKKIQNLTFNGIRGKTYLFNNFEKQDFAADEFSLNLTSILETGRYSITYLKLLYPQAIHTPGTQQEVLQIEQSSKKNGFISFNANNNTQYKLIDISNPYEVTVLPSVNNKNIISTKLNLSTNEKKILIYSEPYEALSISKYEFTPLNEVDFNYLIISNSSLWESAKEYEQYRQSSAGGNYKVLLVNIADLYNHFNYGEPSPLAISNFVKSALKGNDYNKYLLLIGHSVSFHGRINSELLGTFDNNPLYKDYWQIPTIGYPGSDLLLVDGLDNNRTNVPGIPVGRISAVTNSEVKNYLQKVIQYESPNTSNNWKKRIMHMSGGKTASEINSLKQILQDLEPSVRNGAVGGDIFSLSKQTLNPVDNVDISSQVNEGVGLITYFGHGSAVTTDFNMGYASPVVNKYNNTGKYPLMYFNGCGVGNIFSGRYQSDLGTGSQIALSTDWVISNSKGAIAVLANSHDSYASTTTRYLQYFYNDLFNNSESLSIGKIQKSVAQKIVSQSANDYDIANLHQSVLQGDPALHIFSFQLPDYTIKKNSNIFLTTTNNNTIESSSYLQIGVIINNDGRNQTAKEIDISATLFYNDNTSIIKEVTIPNISYQDTIFFQVENSKPLARILINIDKDNFVEESNKENNTGNLFIDWDVAKNLSFYSSDDNIDNVPPILKVFINNKIIENKSILPSNITLNVLIEDNLTLFADTQFFDLYLKRCENCTFEALEVGNSNLHQVSENEVRLITPIYNLSEGDYELIVYGRDLAGNITSSPYHITFKIKSELPLSEIYVIASPNPASSYVKIECNYPELINAPEEILEIEYSIMNIYGIKIAQYTNPIISDSSDTFFWIPTSPGHYIYQVLITRLNGEKKSFKGKLIVN